MALPVWPSSFPRPMLSGFGTVLPDGRQSTSMQAGPPRVRRRYSSAATIRQATMILDVNARQRFWRFWGDDTTGGSLPFLVPDWTLDGRPLATASGEILTTTDGVPLLVSAWHLALFGTDQPPSEAPLGVQFRMTFTLSILP